MFEEHPSFRVPENPPPIWRFLSLTKYLSILTFQQLFFCRADLLGDPFEGSTPKWIRDAEMETLPKAVQTHHSMVRRSIRERMYVNCWHLNEHESAAMWKSFANHEGIAIRSTVERLKGSLRDEPKQIHIGTVDYVDYGLRHQGQPNRFATHNVFIPLLHKRRSFEHEREIRAITCDFFNAEDPASKGLDLAVDVKLLIDSVFVAPESKPHFQALVQKLTGSLGFNFPILRSSMSDEALF